MISPARVICLSLIFFLLISAGGCAPKSETEADEQKERNYLTGRRRLAALDYNGAVEAFEQALVVNPRSASAHFELGVLYEQKLSDYAAAIYHYERALRFRPDLPQAANIRPRIKACKVELADRESLMPVNAAVQKDLDRLTAENLRLRQQASQWLAQLAQLSNNLAMSSAAVQRANSSWTNPLPPTRSAAIASSNSFAPPDGAAGPGASRILSRPPGRPLVISNSPPPAFPAARTRHVVKPGESAYSIARSYSLKFNKLAEANPTIDLKKLRPGQVLAIPSPGL